MNIEKLDLPIASLVEDRPLLKGNSGKLLFVTISPSASLVHTVENKSQVMKIKGRNKTRKLKCRYDQLPQKLQYDYCERIFKTCYANFIEGEQDFVGTWELNSSGNVHFHFIFYSSVIQNDYQLQILRRDIANHEIVIKNMSKKNKKDYMNNIVFVNKDLDDIIDYMDKDWDQKKNILPNFRYSQVGHVDVVPNIEKQPPKSARIKGQYLDEITLKFN